MGINLKRIALAQYILSTKDESFLENVFRMLKLEKSDKKSEVGIAPMTIEELNLRIDASEEDFKNGRVIDSEELFAKYVK